MFRVDLSPQAEKDIYKCIRIGRGKRLSEIMTTLEEEPRRRTQNFERLIGDLKNHYSRRIDYHNRLVYTVDDNTECARDEHGNLYEGVVRIHRAWGHYYKKSAK